MSGEVTLDELAPSRRRLALAMTAVALLASLAAAAGIPGRATYGARVSADEPYYLLSALAFSTDGALNIADELAAERWRPFHEARLPQQTEPLSDGRRVAPHDPLLPVLLAPPGFQTLATTVWTATEDAYLAEASLAAILLVLLSAALTWALVLRQSDVVE